MDAYKGDVVVVYNQNGCLYSWGSYFLWVLTIPTLQYEQLGTKVDDFS